MKKLCSLINGIFLWLALSLPAQPVVARQVYVEGYPTKGTPEQEEQWYNQHVKWCLDRMMAYTKTEGRRIKCAVSWGGGGAEMLIGDGWYGEAHVRKSQKVADWWAAKDDEYLYGRIPADPPSELCLGYHAGCPIHGGMRGTLQPDLHQPYHYQCSRGKEWWYPGCKVKNPATGEEITVIDDGNGWTAPEGFAGAGTTYHFKRTYPTDLIKKYVWGGPYSGEVNRKDPSGWPPALALGIMYETTGDAKYAHAQGILLNRLAEVYRTYYRPEYYRRGKASTKPLSRWAQLHRMCPANFEPQHMETISIAYDLTFAGIAKDPSIVEFFATKGDADYNGDGKLTPEDITYNIRKNLFGYMYELMNRSYHMGQGAQKAVFTIAVVCQNPVIFADAVEELNLMVDNEHYRDGMNWEDSSSYRGCSKGYVNAAKYLEGFCDGKIIKEPFSLLSAPDYKLNKYLSCDPLRFCDGRKPAIGDSGNKRSAIGPTAPADGELAQSVLFDGAGYAILRAGEDINTRKHLLVYFGQSSNAHGHWDQLHLQPVAYGYDLSMQIGYWAAGGAKHHAFNKGTVNHNTVEVDIKAQNIISMGTLKMYGITDPVKVCEVSSASAYDQCSVYRRVSALIDVGPDEHFIADIFRVAGGKTHDYLWHSLGGDNGEHFKIATEEGVTFIAQEKGTLLGENVAFGTEKHQGDSGYSWLKDVARASTDRGWMAAWLADPEKQIGLRLHMTGAPGREVITCKGEGYGIVVESPWDAYTLTRHHTDTEPCVSIFAAVVEPHKGDTFITNVRRLPMEPYTASQPGLEPVALAVETTRNKTFYILHNPERDTKRTLQVDGHSFELTGQFATVCFTAGEFDYAMIANGERLVADGKLIEATGVVTGKLTAMDLERKLVEVEANKPIVMQQPPDRDKATFYNPHYARGETFPICGVKHLAANRYQLDFGNTWLYEGRGKVTEINPDANMMMTMTSQYKLFCDLCHDGKWLRGSDKNDDTPWYQIKHATEKFHVAEGAKFTMLEPGCAEKMKPGDLFWIYSIAPGDTFEIGNSTVLASQKAAN